jgi:hypothetical protein
MRTRSERRRRGGRFGSLLTYPFRLGPPHQPLAWNRFAGLALVNSLSSSGDALVAVALAGSIFVSVPVHAARGRTALGLVCTLLPFVVVAPFTGPLTDRVRAGQRTVIFLAGLGRVVACVMIAAWLDSLLLFPAAFVYLVCSKTHAVARASLVPVVVDHPEVLVPANAKLAAGSSLASGCAAGVGALFYKLLGSDAVLAVASLIFAAGAALAVDLLPSTRPQQAPTDPGPSRSARLRAPAAVLRAGSAMAGLRAMSGLLTALVIFGLRQQGAPLAWYGAVGVAALAANLCGALVAPWARRFGAEGRLVAASSLLVGLTAIAVSQWPEARRRPAALVLVIMIALGASIAKTAFDAIVQEEIPPSQRATFFARLEALLQSCWVVGALIPTLVVIPLLSGFVVVAIVVLLTGAVAAVGLPRFRHPTQSRPSDGPEQTHHPPLRHHQIS